MKIKKHELLSGGIIGDPPVDTRNGPKTKGFGYQVLGFGSGVAGGIAPYTLVMLIVGGGGGAGGGSATAGGGGGSVGYRTSSQSNPDQGTQLTITIGAGGGGGGGGSNGSLGNTSSISGTGLTTITSEAGGPGGRDQQSAPTAGTKASGGGGGAFGGEGAPENATPDQGNDGGN